MFLVCVCVCVYACNGLICTVFPRLERACSISFSELLAGFVFEGAFYSMARSIYLTGYLFFLIFKMGQRACVSIVIFSTLSQIHLCTTGIGKDRQ